MRHVSSEVIHWSYAHEKNGKGFLDHIHCKAFGEGGVVVETEPRLVPYMFISEKFRLLDAILIRMSHSQMLHSYQNGV